METYIAHQDEVKRIQLLRDHIRGVESIAAGEGEKLGISQTMRLIALFHDMGKYSDDFQKYIRQTPDEEVHSKVNHSSAGAEILMNLYLKSRRSDKLQSLIEMLCYVITAHHGLYDMVSIEDEDKFVRRLNEVEAQEARMVFERWSHDLHINISDMTMLMQKACKEYKSAFVQKFRDISDVKEYWYYQGCFARLLLSMQIDADWTDTGNAMEPKLMEELPEIASVIKEAWDHYCDYMEKLRYKSVGKPMSKKEVQIDQLRTQIQQESLSFTKHPSGIYCLAIPTGAGKTLTSLGYALKYAHERIGTKESVERIFYISPYISITEQNAQVMKEAVGNADWVMEHHSNVVNSDDNARNAETSWEEIFICTTMVQFLNTLFSDKKKSIRRFHRLKHAVIILDEVQALPVKTIHTFNLMMNFLSRMCGSTVILCTATQPMLDAPEIRRKIEYSTPRDMIANLDRKFAVFERVQIDTALLDMKITAEDLVEQIQKTFLEVHSILVICNRKESVAALYDKLSQQCENTNVFYLTTNLCAEHRSEVFAQIKGLLGKSDQKTLIISTNLIEAGVDLSVECVYRSLAGIDSIAQSAGRCNRNGELDKGTVRVFELEGDEPGRHMDELLVAQQKTREILYRHKTMQASESILVPEWMQQYYEIFYGELKSKMDFTLTGRFQGETIFGLLSEGFSETRAAHSMRQAFQTAGAAYEAIADTGFTVIVPYGEGIGLIGKLEQSTEKENIRYYLKKLQRYTVAVYSYKVEQLLKKGVIRECCKVPDVYIAFGYDEKKGLTDIMPEAIF